MKLKTNKIRLPAIALPCRFLWTNDYVVFATELCNVLAWQNLYDSIGFQFERCEHRGRETVFDIFYSSTISGQLAGSTYFEEWRCHGDRSRASLLTTVLS